MRHCPPSGRGAQFAPRCPGGSSPSQTSAINAVTDASAAAVHIRCRYASTTVTDARADAQYRRRQRGGGNDGAAAMLMDYPNRRRLKINALAEFRELKDDADLARRLASLGYKARSSTRCCSGLNCPQHITSCSREPELAQALDPVRYRSLDLEGEMRAFRAASSNPVSAAIS